jgi:thiol:disulfide interchange protein
LESQILLDVEGAVSELYGVKSIPGNIFIDSDGIVTENITGGLEAESILEKLEQGYQK